VLEGEGDAGAGMRYGVEDVVGEDVAARPRGDRPALRARGEGLDRLLGRGRAGAEDGRAGGGAEVRRRRARVRGVVRASVPEARGGEMGREPAEGRARQERARRQDGRDRGDAGRRASLEARRPQGGRSGARSAPASAIAAPARGVVPPRTGGDSRRRIDDLRPARGLVSCVAQQSDRSLVTRRAPSVARAPRDSTLARAMTTPDVDDTASWLYEAVIRFLQVRGASLARERRALAHLRPPAKTSRRASHPTTTRPRPTPPVPPHASRASPQPAPRRRPRLRAVVLIAPPPSRASLTDPRAFPRPGPHVHDPRHGLHRRALRGVRRRGGEQARVHRSCTPSSSGSWSPS
jgi:hypothetical protein